MILALLLVGFTLHINAFDPRLLTGRILHSFLLINLIFQLWKFSENPVVVNLGLVNRGFRFFVGLLCIVFSIEISARLVPLIDTKAKNPGYPFFDPDFMKQEHNSSLFLDDREYFIPRVTDRYRVLFFGNSYTQGAGLRRRETFPRVAEKALSTFLKNSRSQYAVDAYNMGRAGQYTVEQVRTALEEMPKFRPDAMVISYVMTDVQRKQQDPLAGGPPAWLKPWMDSFAEFMMNRIGSYAYYRLYDQISIFNYVGRDFLNDMEGMYADSSNNWKEMTDAYEKLAAYCKENDIDYHFVVFPRLFQSLADSRTNAMLDKVVRVVKAQGYHVIDLRTAFERYGPDLTHLAVSPRDPHPKAQAAAVAGEEIARNLQESLFLRKPESKKTCQSDSCAITQL
jgi:hypothetical protein